MTSQFTTNTTLLLEELAKPVEQIRKKEVLDVIKRIDGSDINESPMIFFLLETLFDFATQGCTISMRDLLRAVLANATLTPILYQIRLKEKTADIDDNEVKQMVAFIQSFK